MHRARRTDQFVDRARDGASREQADAERYQHGGADENREERGLSFGAGEEDARGQPDGNDAGPLAAHVERAVERFHRLMTRTNPHVEPARARVSEGERTAVRRERRAGRCEENDTRAATASHLRGNPRQAVGRDDGSDGARAILHRSGDEELRAGEGRKLVTARVPFASRRPQDGFVDAPHRTGALRARLRPADRNEHAAGRIHDAETVVAGIEGHGLEQSAKRRCIVHAGRVGDSLCVRREADGLEKAAFVVAQGCARTVEGGCETSGRTRSRLGRRAVRDDPGAEATPDDHEDGERHQQLRVDGQIGIAASHTITDTGSESMRSTPFA